MKYIFLNLIVLCGGFAFVYAASSSPIDFTGLNSLIRSLSNGVVRSLGYMMFTLAIVAFFWGVVSFIASIRQGAGEKEVTKGKQFMMWGLIALFVMFSLWGIITFAQGIFGIKGSTTIQVPRMIFQRAGSQLSAGDAFNGFTGRPTINGPDTTAGNSATIGNIPSKTPDENPAGESTTPEEEFTDISEGVTDNPATIDESVPVTGKEKFAYVVSGGRLGSLVENSTGKQPDKDLNETLWGMFVISTTPQILDQVSRFEVYPNSNGSTMAFVTHKDQPGNQYAVGIYLPAHTLPNGKLDTGEVYASFLHEGMHIVTLGFNSQIKPLNDVLDCNTFYTLASDGKLGCLTPSSYLTQFTNQFWNYDTRSDTGTSKFGRDKVFVSGYASTNPREDIAETYAKFVVTDRPAGTTVVEKKILFFYNFPEFVSMRSAARAGIGMEAQSRSQDRDNDGVSDVIEKAGGTNPEADNEAETRANAIPGDIELPQEESSDE